MPLKIMHLGLRRTPALSLLKNTFRLPALILAAGIMVYLGGCGVSQLTRGELTPPKVTLKSVAFGLPTPQGLPLECALLVENPNPQDLRVLGYDYELRLEGQLAVQGESRGEVNLPARGQVMVAAPMLVKLQALPRLLPGVLNNDKKIHYQVSGGVRLASLLGGFRVPFNFQGRANPKEGLEQLRLFMK